MTSRPSTAGPILSIARKRKPWLQFSLRTFLLLPLIAVLGAMAYRQWYQAWALEQSRIVPTAWDLATGKNVRWSVPLGSTSCGSPVVSGGRVFVGTNNTQSYLPRYSATVDLGVLLCFREADGEFLWQASSQKLSSGRMHDWPMQGIWSTPAVAGNRLWYVTNRCELVCLDTEGFHDDENDGLYQNEVVRDLHEADIVWTLDMVGELGVSPHYMSASSPAVVGGRVFVVTGNGCSETGQEASAAPSFLAADAATGEVLWTDNSPGANVMDGQWGSPSYGIVNGTPQIVFPGGDGWLYSFDPAGGSDGKSKLLWKFDCNLKTAQFAIGGFGTRNHVIASPLFHQNRLYAAAGQNPEFGEGLSCVWCIDPTKRGDVSPELVFNKKDPEHPIAYKRVLACDATQGDFIQSNPNSAAIWMFAEQDDNADGDVDFEEAVHRTICRIAAQAGLIVVTDSAGIVHCLDAKTGLRHWTHDLMASAWSSPLIAGGHLYVGDEDGDIAVFKLSADPLAAKGPSGTPLTETNMNASVYATPAAANNTLFVVSKNQLVAIKDSKAQNTSSGPVATKATP
jgi:outer membrane protein assembly factor BamB